MVYVMLVPPLCQVGWHKTAISGVEMEEALAFLRSTTMPRRRTRWLIILIFALALPLWLGNSAASAESGCHRGGGGDTPPAGAPGR